MTRKQTYVIVGASLAGAKAAETLAFWLFGERIVAGMNVNVWDVNDAIQRLISERAAVDDGRLADPGVPLDGVGRVENESVA